jgi:YVTN family beta-propeller protein/YD repeat-containing protein
VTFAPLDRWEVYEGQTITVRISAEDPDHPLGIGMMLDDGTLDADLLLPRLVWNYGPLPPGAVFTPETQVLRWTPGPLQAGAYAIPFQVTDDGDGTGVATSAQTVLHITVRDLNAAPTLAPIPNRSLAVVEGAVALLAIPVSAVDPDGTVPVLSASGLPAFATFVDHGDGTGTLTASPSLTAQRGDYPITIRATDDGNGDPRAALSHEQTFVLSVTARNAVPVMAVVPDRVAVAGQTLTFTVTVTDPDEDPLVFGAGDGGGGFGLPAGAAFAASATYGQAVFTWTPGQGSQGLHTVQLNVTDSGNGDPALAATTFRTFTITVRDANQAPVLLPVGARTVAEGQPLSVTLRATDPDADPVFYQAATLPRGAVLDPSSGLFTWTPDLTQAGTYKIRFSAADGMGASSEDVTIRVTPTNQAPIFIPLRPMLTYEGTGIQFAVTAGDLDGDPLSYAAAATLPAGASFDPIQRIFAWVPGHHQAGSYTLAFSATDPGGLSALVEVVVEVLDVNLPPSVEHMSGHVLSVGAAFAMTVPGSDPDEGATLSYRADDLPAGAALDPATGLFTWTPLATQLGEHRLRFTVSDGQASTSRAVTLVVSFTPIPPDLTVELTPGFPVTPGQAVLIHPIAAGVADIATLNVRVDGQTLALDRYGRARFVPDRTGRFTVLATAVDVDGIQTTRQIDIRVRDPQDTAAPAVALLTPGPGDMISNSTPIRGTVADVNLELWTLEAALAGTDDWRLIGQGTGPVTAGPLTTLDPGLFPDGFYTLRLTARDMGGRSAAVQRAVEIRPADRSAVFIHQRTDLRATLGGTVIDLTRRYDTATARTAGIFGHGWTLLGYELQPLSSVAPTGGETRGLFAGYQNGTRLIVTLPDGRAAGFTFSPQGFEQPGMTVYRPAWTADEGHAWTLATADAVLVEGRGVYYAQESGLPYNPANGAAFGEAAFILTAPDGTRYAYGPEGRLRVLTTAAGVRVTVTDAGLFAADGSYVAFQKDRLGRIVYLTTSQGTRIAYDYDDQGNLTAVVDLAGGMRTWYGYTPQDHLLTLVADPGQGLALEALYAGGRLTATRSLDGVIESLRQALGGLPDTLHGAVRRWVLPIGAAEAATAPQGIVLLAATVRGDGFTPGLPVIPGASAVETRVSGDTAFGLFVLNGPGLYVVEIDAAAQGACTLTLAPAGDLDGDGLVDGSDALRLDAAAGSGLPDPNADVNRDGTVDGTDRYYLERMYGFVANRAPLMTGAAVGTYLDIPVAVDLAALTSDPDGNRVDYVLTRVLNGAVVLAGDGRSAYFRPATGFTGTASFDVIADDGAARAVAVTVTVEVSNASLTGVQFRSAEAVRALDPGAITHLVLYGTFADGGIVALPPGYAAWTSSDPAVAVVDGTGRLWARTPGTAVITVHKEGTGLYSAAAVVVGTQTGYATWDIYPDSYLLEEAEARQILFQAVDDAGAVLDLSAAAAGTTYVSADTGVVTVGPDGRITAVGTAGQTTRVIVINGAIRREIRIGIGAPVQNGGQVGAGGAVVESPGGVSVHVPPETLSGQALTITDLAQASLEAALPGGFAFVQAFALSFGGLDLTHALGLAVPLDGSGHAPGDDLFVLRRGWFVSGPGQTVQGWELVDRAVVDAGGVARTTSPPYSGAISEGVYVLADAEYAILRLDSVYPDAVIEVVSGTQPYFVRPDSVFQNRFPLPLDATRIRLWRVADDGRAQYKDAPLAGLTAGKLVPLYIEVAEPTVEDRRPFVTSARLAFQDGRPTVTVTATNLGQDANRLRVVFFTEGRTDRTYATGVADLTGDTFQAVVPAALPLGRLAFTVEALVTRYAFRPGADPRQVSDWIAGAAVSPDYDIPYLVWTANIGSNTVSAIDPMAAGGPRVIKEIPVGKAPADLVVSADGLRVFVANSGEGTVSVIDTISLTEIDIYPDVLADPASIGLNRIRLGTPGAQPWFMALDPDTGILYLADRAGGYVYTVQTAGDRFAYTGAMNVAASTGKALKGLTGIAVTEPGQTSGVRFLVRRRFRFRPPKSGIPLLRTAHRRAGGVLSLSGGRLQALRRHGRQGAGPGGGGGARARRLRPGGLRPAHRHPQPQPGHGPGAGRRDPQDRRPRPGGHGRLGDLRPDQRRRPPVDHQPGAEHQPALGRGHLLRHQQH